MVVFIFIVIVLFEVVVYDSVPNFVTIVTLAVLANVVDVDAFLMYIVYLYLILLLQF